MAIKYSRSLLLTVIYSFLESKPNRAWVIANVFVNLSSFEHGRRYVAQEKIYLGLIPYMSSEKDALRLAILRILRNVAFLWEEPEIGEDLMRKDNQVIDSITAHMLLMLHIGSASAGTDLDLTLELLTKHFCEVLGEQDAI